MAVSWYVNTIETPLLDLVRAYCFPAGEDAARRIRAVRIAERGEMQTAPQARPIGFTAEMEIDARASRFRWAAQFRGGLRLFSVVDAYENGRGRLSLRAAALPLKTMAGPDFDRGELLRYLASFALCPPMLLNHPSLVWTPAGPHAIELRDGDAALELQFDDSGCPAAFRGERPRTVGSRAVTTGWSGRAAGFREWDGIRVAGQTEASWHLDGGPFLYYRSDVTAVTTLL